MTDSQKVQTSYEVVCLDSLGYGHTEVVEYSHKDAQSNLHGCITRTGQMVKFWERNDNVYVGIAYDKVD